MSILIKGMEMPKKPGAYSMKIRLFVKEDGTASIWGLEEYIPHEPLDVIPVPPHGRLIDADALKGVQQEDADLFRNATTIAEKSRRDEALNAVANIVNAPTIIPEEPFNNLSKPYKAEEGET